MMQFFTALWQNGFWGMDTATFQITIFTIGRLILAALLGGAIGYERQHSHQPAGMRTHVVVAVASALVMCTSEFVATKTGSTGEVLRIGAQVVSGIGFLGAGTILREGFSVKGLTTAASLWAVACIGIAAGIGFWPGALIATGVIYLTLNSMKKFARRHSRVKTIYIGVGDEYHVSERVTEIFQAREAKLKRLEIIFPEEQSKDVTKVLKVLAYVKDENELMLIRENVLALEGVHDFDVE